MVKVADVMFVLDTTGSMDFAINAMKNCIGEVSKIYLESRINVQIGLSEFRDRVHTLGEDELIRSRSYPTFRITKTDSGDMFTSDIFQLTQNLDALKAEGGGPEPESSFDALHLVSNQAKWRQGAHRILILITDAPPNLPDFAIKNTRNLINSLNRCNLNQIHIVCPVVHQPEFIDLSEIMQDGPSGSKFVELSFHDLSTDVEQLIEKLREVAKTSSDSIGSSPNDGPKLVPRDSVNPFDDQDTDNDENLDHSTEEEQEIVWIDAEGNENNPFDDY